MPRRETSRREWYRLAITVILCAVLAACTPEGQVQETKPAITQTRVEIAVASATPNATATATKTEIPSSTPTPEATATPTATPTSEATPTPQAPEFPSNFETKFPLLDRENIPFLDYGEGYVRKSWPIVIRTQDLHLDESTIIVGDGRYHIQGWADAWFMEVDGTQHHITVPLMIFDTETFKVWGIHRPVFPSPTSTDRAKKIIMEAFTGPFSENAYAMHWLEESMCFSASGERVCNGQERPLYRMDIGYIPTADINTTRCKEGIQHQVDFLRELIEGVYTQDNVEAFLQTFDPSLLQLNELNLPPNFIIPLSFH